MLHDQAVFIYIQPPSVEELSKRIIRTRPGTETEATLTAKMTYAMREMEMAKRLDFIDHIFTNSNQEDFIKRAACYLTETKFIQGLKSHCM